MGGINHSWFIIVLTALAALSDNIGWVLLQWMIIIILVKHQRDARAIARQVLKQVWPWRRDSWWLMAPLPQCWWVREVPSGKLT